MHIQAHELRTAHHPALAHASWLPIMAALMVWLSTFTFSAYQRTV